MLPDALELLPLLWWARALRRSRAERSRWPRPSATRARCSQRVPILVGDFGVEVLHRHCAEVGHAARTNAATIDDHVSRFRELADAGVQTAIVNLPDLSGTEPVERLAEIIAAFR